MPIMKNLKQVSKISISGFIASTFPSAFLALSALATGNMFSGGVQGGADKGRGEGVPTQLFGEGNTGIFTQMINMMLFAVGILSVVMLIYGGLRYILSNGDSKKVDAAKNTILYAIVGLIIAMLSYAIINFIISLFTGSTGTGFGGGSNGANGIPPTNV